MGRITGGRRECQARREDDGAGNGARTRGIKLGKLALYQLSYARLNNIVNETKEIGNRLWAMGKDEKDFLLPIAHCPSFSAFPVVPEPLLEYRGDEVVDGGIVVPDHDRILPVDELVHELVRHDS